MKFIAPLLFLLLAIASCNEADKKQSNQKIKIYNTEDFNSKVEIVDTLCINETNRAKEDIKKGKISLNGDYWLQNIHYYRTKSYFNKDDVFKELSNYNITKDTTLIIYNDIRTLAEDYFKKGCYQKIMKYEVEKILRKNGTSLDSLIAKSERQYVFNHPDEIYKTIDSDDDRPARKDCYNFMIKSEIDFIEEYPYPDDYKFKNEKYYSYINADFILMKDGTIENLTVEATFQNPENLKYKSYFENGLRKFVLKTKWIHPKYSGIIRNSEMHFNIYFK